MVSRRHGAPVIWVGTCGFAGRQSDAYARVQIVEIQETFYHPLAVPLARKWRAAAPAGFRFAVKASQFITHEASSPTYRRGRRVIRDEDRGAYGGFQDSARVREGWQYTRDVAEALRADAIVFQSPASFGPTEDHVAALYRFFEAARTDAVRAWEPRGAWATHLVEKICDDLGLVHAVDPFASEPATSGLAYFRLHGSPPGPRMYSYRYSEADLQRLDATCREYDDAYVLFNNVSMADDAGRFRALL